MTRLACAAVGAMCFGVFLAGCSSGSGGNGGGSGVSGTPVTGAVDVYAAGSVTLVRYQSSVATVWKNGVATTIGSSTAQSSDACCVVVSGADVYAAGEQYYGQYKTAVVWKNGVVTNLTDGSADANVYGLAVVGSDVYAVGYDSGGGKSVSTARLWKNGVATVLPDRGMGGASGYGVAVAAGNVYVAGSVVDASTPGSGEYPALWTNGVLSFPGSEANFGGANAVVVSGPDLYLGGQASLAPHTSVETPVYWKNGTLVPLAAATVNGYVYGMAVAGTDVYVAGKYDSGNQSLGTIWKNGAILDYSGGNGSSFVNGVAVAGGSVYAVGLQFPQALTWKDGVASALGTGTVNNPTDAYSLFVVQH